MGRNTQIQSVQTGHVDLNVTNLSRSKKFYQEVFGFQVVGEPQQENRRFALLGDGQKLILTLCEQREDSFEKRRPGLHHLAFQMDTIDKVKEVEQKLKDLNIHFFYDGIVPHAEGMDSGGIFFEDPDGISLEIYSPNDAKGQSTPTPGALSCGLF